MKKFLLTSLYVILAITATLAQPGTGHITGMVKDSTSGELLESATIIIYKADSTVLTFKIADNKGQFDITGIPLKATYRLVASYTGYMDYTLKFTMDAALKKLDTIFLKIKSNEEVIVTSIAPIRMNGDTLEINPAAFKMAAESVAEDLLNKVPGMVVWADGSITMNGKAIPKVLVDGKPFLGSNDHRIATQNLPKNIIEKIQVYNEVDLSSETNRSRMADANAPKDSLLTMNIKLKEDKKKGFFGKYGAGLGTDNRYQTDLSLQTYNKQSSLTIGGGANNINADIAGLSDVLRENTFRNNYSVYRSRSNFGRGGINRVISPGIQFSHSFTNSENDRRSNRIDGGYEYNNNLGKNINQSFQERYLKGGDQFTTAYTENINRNEQHLIRANYSKNSDYNNRFNINGSGRTSTTQNENTNGNVIRDKNNALVSDKKGSSTSTGTGKSFNAGASYSNFDYENALKAIDISTSFSQGETHNNRLEKTLYNFYSAGNTTTSSFNRRYLKDGNNTEFTGSLSYNGLKRLLMGRFDLFGIDLSTSHNISFQKNKDANTVYDIDSLSKQVANRSLTYSETFSTFEYVPEVSISKSFNKWSSKMWRSFFLRAAINKQFVEEKNISTRANRNIDRNFKFLRYNLSASFNKTLNEVYRINGSINTSRNNTYANINQIAPVIDSINLYSLYKGGLNLINSYSNNYSIYLNYSTANSKKPNQFSASLNGNMNHVFKPFIDSTIFLRDTIKINGLDSVFLNGRQLRYTINGPKRNNFNIGYNTNFSRKYNANQIQVRYSGNFNFGKSPSYIDNVYTIINSSNINQNIGFTYYYKTFLIVGISGNANYNNSKQTGYRNSNFKTRTMSGEFNVTVHPVSDASIGSNISYSKNNGIVTPITIWNVNTSYRFMKGKQAEIKFTATDILKQFKNINYYANPDGVTTTISNGLQQYFMITLSYFPRKFGGEPARQERGGNREQRSERQGMPRRGMRN